MAIPDPLITEAIQQSSYYPNYLKMVAANTKKTPRETPPPTKKPSKRKLPQKVRKGKPTFKLVDEDDEDRQETIPHEEGNDPDLELAMKLSLETDSWLEKYGSKNRVLAGFGIGGKAGERLIQVGL
ncbi:hypothetical protein Tco_1388996 [Tanacetum coccineum]